METLILLVSSHTSHTLKIISEIQEVEYNLGKPHQKVSLFSTPRTTGKEEPGSTATAVQTGPHNH